MKGYEVGGRFEAMERQKALLFAGTIRIGRNRASNQCFRKLKILVGNIKIVRNLVLWQLTERASLEVGVMGFQKGFDPVLLKDTHLGFYGFHGITRKYTAVR